MSKGKLIITENNLNYHGLTIKPSKNLLYIHSDTGTRAIPVAPSNVGGLITRSTTSEVAELPPGASGRMLRTNPNSTFGLEWVTAPIPTQKGGLITRSDTQEVAELPPGTTGTFLRANSASTFGIEWSNLPSMTYCQVRRTTAVSISNNTNTLVSFETRVVDTGNYFNIANPSRLTVQTAGVYLLDFFPLFATNTTGFRRSLYNINNGTITTINSKPTISGGNADARGCLILFLNANDYIQLYVLQNSGGALNLVSAEATIVRLSSL